jgi:hypothetical protein
MPRLAPITYRIDDIETDDVPGIHIADVEAEIAITGYAPDFDWYLDEVRVGWEHAKLWRTYPKGHFVFEIIDKYLRAHCDEDIFDRCAEQAAEDAWWDGVKP